MCLKNILEITFLGTGTSQGIPIIGSKHPVCLSQNPKDKRLRVSLLLKWETYTFVIDCGPDFRQQMLNQNVQQLDGILYTHEHNDHIIGLDDVRPFYFRQGDINLFASQRVIKALKKRFDYVFESHNKYPGAPSVNLNEIVNEPFEVGGKQVTPIEVMHNTLPIFGFRVDNMAYITDAKTIDATEKLKLKNLDVLILNALRREPHPSHLNLEEALALIEELKPKKAYLTHISHLLGFHDEVERELPENVHLAYDNLKLTL